MEACTLSSTIEYHQSLYALLMKQKNKTKQNRITQAHRMSFVLLSLDHENQPQILSFSDLQADKSLL